MIRKTRIDEFSLFSSHALDEKWRARIEIFSTTGEKEEEENFRASLNLPIEIFDKNPEEIKKDAFEKLIKTLETVKEDLIKKINRGKK